MKTFKMSILSIIALLFLTNITFLNRAEAATSGNDIAQFSKKYQGVPYVFGGTTPSGFDCSGFVRYVYSHYGVTLPRTAESQYAVGKAVAKSNLQPGDMVFFSNTYKAGISHAGIYIGANQFISAESKGVAINTLSNTYWGPKYTGARRIIEEAPTGTLFSDLPDNHPAFTAIKVLNEQNVIKGYDNNIYKPEEEVTRGQAAAIINRVLDYDAAKVSFKDVGTSNPFATDISAIQAKGIIQGYSDDTFRPYEPMTRAQMAVILERAFKLNLDGTVSKASVSYSDVPANYWAYAAIKAVHYYDTTTVYQTAKFRATDEASRADFAAAIYSSIKVN